MTATPPPTEPASPEAGATPTPAEQQVTAPAPAEGDAPAAAEPAATDVPALGSEPESQDAVPKLGDDVEPEESADGEKTGEGETDEGEGEDDGEEAPIEYAFEAPEGAPEYREEVIGVYKDVLQKHRVDPDVAKDILDTMLPTIQKDVDAQVQNQIKTQTDEWSKQLAERHGNKLGDVRRLANRALQKAATPELRTFLRDSALAEHPDFNDMLAAFGQQVTNDRPPKGGPATRGKALTPVEEAALEYEQQKRGH